MVNKEYFLAERDSWKDTQLSRWEFLKNSFSKSIRVRMVGKGTYANGLIRTACVKVPSSLSTQLCREDLAMLVAGGPVYGSFRISQKSQSNVIQTMPGEGGFNEFSVTVVMDIGLEKIAEIS